VEIPSPALLAAGAAVFFLAYVVKGVSSFGPALVSVPILSLLWPDPRLYVPLLATINLAINVVFAFRMRRGIQWRLMAPLAVGVAAGAPLGAHVLESMSADTIRALIGAIVLASVVALHLARRGGGVRVPAGAARTGVGVALGVLAGFSGSSVAIDGPPFLIFLTAVVPDKGQRYATILALFSFSAAARTASYAAEGILDPLHGWITLGALPFALGGMVTGLVAFERLSDKGFDRVVLGLLTASGLALLANAFV
jgi:uncharacterized membrane protein YfcA